MQQGRKGIILATFTRPRVGAFDTFGQLCCSGGGEFDSFFSENVQTLIFEPFYQHFALTCTFVLSQLLLNKI